MSAIQNFIGIALWIAIGVVAGLLMKTLVRRPEDDRGSGTLVLVFLSVFGALIGGMLGVGIFHLREPLALSSGGIGGAIFLSVFMGWLYRWGIRVWV
ncbi:MAG: hypothetical protein HY701_07250 [Gemmatimonadetes bacterium]|nr:hypothetical protein [Gemmatimonadota bacterium]